MEKTLEIYLQEERQRIADLIMALDIPKDISSDWYAAGLRTRMVCSIIATGSKDLTVQKIKELSAQ